MYQFNNEIFFYCNFQIKNFKNPSDDYYRINDIFKMKNDIDNYKNWSPSKIDIINA